MPCEHRLLDHDFAVGARKSAPPQRAVLAFGVFADHVEVDVAGLAAHQRARHPGHQTHWPQVHVLVKFAAKQQQRAPKRDMIGHGVRPTHSAEENRVVSADPIFPVVGHHLAMIGVVGAAGEIEVIELQADAEAIGRSLQDAQAFGNDFIADPVAGNHGDAMCGHENSRCQRTGGQSNQASKPASGRKRPSLTSRRVGPGMARCSSG